MSDMRINDHSDEFFKQLDDNLEKALTEIGIHIEGEAKEELENTPRRIDTGLLRNSITHALDGGAPATTTYTSDDGSESGSYSGTAPKEGGHDRSVIVGTNVEYAVYVSEGTSQMAPNRFLKNAVERNKDQIKAKIDEALHNF